jgi:formylglycine-generating enzyme required for sulfatase activity
MDAALAKAESWLARRGEDLPGLDREFIAQSVERERRARNRARSVQALVFVLLFTVIAGLIGSINQDYIKEQANWFFTMRPYRAANVSPYVLVPQAERALKPMSSFRECAKDCPEMVVIPAGTFTMGSPADEEGRFDNEGPQHLVTIAKPFAVSKFEVTFAEWDACAAVGGCAFVPDSQFGRGTRPIINVSWDDAQQYVAWFSRMTGKPYRLLSEAEWEYVARARTTTPYSFGDEALDQYAWYNANSDNQTHPVGEKRPNPFGLYDIYGNVSEWVQDCYQNSYTGAPMDGSARTAEDCSRRVIRSGSWIDTPMQLRSASRDGLSTFIRFFNLGFRVGRTLAP